jgi:hypothetical protein
MRTLNVKKTTKKEVMSEWGFAPLKRSDILFVRCNSKGEIKWDIAPIYEPIELLERGNYNIISD